MRSAIRKASAASCSDVEASAEISARLASGGSSLTKSRAPCASNALRGAVGGADDDRRDPRTRTLTHPRASMPSTPAPAAKNRKQVGGMALKQKSMPFFGRFLGVFRNGGGRKHKMSILRMRATARPPALLALHSLVAPYGRLSMTLNETAQRSTDQLAPAGFARRGERAPGNLYETQRPFLPRRRVGANGRATS